MTDALANIALTTIDGAEATLANWAGKVVLIVNVASKCGLTPQYEALEAIYRRYRDRGFVVLGFPANDFRGQEPGSEAEIADFCRTSYDVDFPLFAKLAVTGEDQHPLYRALTAACPEAVGTPGEDFRARLKEYGIEPNPAPGVLWNFEKFLLGKDGSVAARFAPDVPPDDPILTDAILAELDR